MARVELSRRAIDDLDELGKARSQVERVLSALAQEPLPPNLDITPLEGKQPWRRLRSGAYRIIFRPLSGRDRHAGAARAFLVVRIVRRRDLERTIRGL